jgi:DNA-binding transcriptional ArsR family regulator
MPEYTLADEPADDVSAAFDLLSDARRRGVLYAAERGEQTTVEELADQIASWLDDAEGDSCGSSVRLSLIHTHLPKLADAGVVEYDRERGTVELAGGATDLEPFLTCVRGAEPKPASHRRISELNA